MSGALNLAPDLLLNAAGYATDDQTGKALERLRAILGSEAPVLIQVPVVDAARPEAATGERRGRILTRREDVRIVDLADARNEPFVGEVLYSLDREPKEGSGVVVKLDGRLGAWTYHPDPPGDVISQKRGRRPATDGMIQGVIIRVTRETNLE